MLNGKPVQKAKSGTLTTINRTWNNGDEVLLQLPMNIFISEWGRNSRAVERGPLVYALKIGERWEEGYDEKEGKYYSVYPTSDWNYGLLDSVVRHPQIGITLHQNKKVNTDFIWNLEHAPIELTTWAKKIPDWKTVYGVARNL